MMTTRITITVTIRATIAAIIIIMMTTRITITVTIRATDAAIGRAAACNVVAVAALLVGR